MPRELAMTIEEAIARAIARAMGDNFDAASFCETLDGSDPEDNRACYLGQAGVALAAIEEAGYRIVRATPETINVSMRAQL